MPPARVQPGYLLSRRATQLAFSALMLGVFVASLNQTIVATALPQIVGDLGGLNEYSWLFSVYILGSTVTVPVWIRMSDVYGRRVIFGTGIGLFLAGALLSVTAMGITQLIAGRLLQGCASGALVPVAMASVGDMIPARDRGRWQGLLGAVLGLASVLGPLTGGWIADHVSWRWVFLVTVPVAVVALAVALATLRIPSHPEHARGLDAPGCALLAGSLSSLLIATSRLGGGVDAITALAALVFVVLGVAFVRHERRTAEPVLPLELLHIRAFSSASLAGLAIGGPMFGAITYVPLYAQGALGASASAAGLVLMPLMFIWFAVSILSGQLITRLGRYKWALVCGPPLMFAGFAVLSLLDSRSSIVTMVCATVIVGIGLGLLYQNLVLVTQNAVPSRHLGAATSATQLFRSSGGTIGVSLMGAIVTAGLAGTAFSAAEAGTGATAAAREAMADAIHPVFLFALPLLLAAWWWTWRVPEVPLRLAVRDDVAVINA